jgi:hypothetical protein
MGMIAEGLRRLLAGLGLSLACALGAPWILLSIVFGRAGYSDSIASALSRLLNAVCGGPELVTFSAWSWELLVQGKPGAALRVWLVDLVNLEPGHCERWWIDHKSRRLIK